MATVLEVGTTAWSWEKLGPADALCAQAETAQAMGFHSFWLPENHFGKPRAIPSPLTLLAAVAGRTERIGLGCTSYLLPIRHPLLAAEEVAVLDQLCQGRLILGVGRGMSSAMFKAFGVAATDKRILFQANLEVMRRAWLSGLLVLSMAVYSLPVAADELSHFESARRNYDKQNYSKTARGLESLVGGAVPRATNSVVRLEARKYLGATYLFLGKDEAAREQFRALLEEDPAYDIDPVAFPEAVVQTFQEVQTEVAAERARQEALSAARKQQERTEELEALIRHRPEQ